MDVYILDSAELCLLFYEVKSQVTNLRGFELSPDAKNLAIKIIDYYHSV